MCVCVCPHVHICLCTYAALPLEPQAYTYKAPLPHLIPHCLLSCTAIIFPPIPSHLLTAHPLHHPSHLTFPSTPLPLSPCHPSPSPLTFPTPFPPLQVRLPDMEFVVNLGDWPLEKKPTDSPVPIISWCGSTDTYDIIMPTYDLTRSTLGAMSQ